MLGGRCGPLARTCPGSARARRGSRVPGPGSRSRVGSRGAKRPHTNRYAPRTPSGFRGVGPRVDKRPHTNRFAPRAPGQARAAFPRVGFRDCGSRFSTRPPARELTRAPTPGSEPEPTARNAPRATRITSGSEAISNERRAPDTNRPSTAPTALTAHPDRGPRPPATQDGGKFRDNLHRALSSTKSVDGPPT